jgi:hypothetical protein
MQTIGNGSKSQAQSSLQTAVSWIIVIVFIALAGDWQTFADYWEKRSQELEASKVSINSPEGRELLYEIRDAIKETDAHALDGTITPEFTAQQQNRIWDASCKLDINHSPYVRRVYNTAIASYLEHWEAPAGLDLDNVWWGKDPEYKKVHLEDRFSREMLLERERNRSTTNDDEIVPMLGRFAWWLLRWYYLLTIPSLLIVMINLVFARKSVREEVIIGYRYWLRAVLGGPIGIFCNSETASRIKRYHELRSQHKWERLSAEEEDALWLQTLKPLLKFEQALEEIRQSEQRLRRPLLVVMLSSVMCVRLIPAAQPEPVTSIVTADDSDRELSTQDNGDDDADNDDSADDSAEPVETTQWAVPMGEVEYRQEAAPCQPVMLAAYRPRGPPIRHCCQGGSADNPRSPWYHQRRPRNEQDADHNNVPDPGNSKYGTIHQPHPQSEAWRQH